MLGHEISGVFTCSRWLLNNSFPQTIFWGFLNSFIPVYKAESFEYDPS